MHEPRSHAHDTAFPSPATVPAPHLPAGASPARRPAHQARDLRAGPRLAARCLLLLLLPILLLPACRDRGAADRPRTILFVGQAESDPLWPILQATAQTYASTSTGLSLRFAAPAGPDPAGQAALVRRVLDAQTSALILHATDAAPTRQLVDELSTRGVPVVLVGHDIGESRRFGYVGWDGFEAGQSLAAALDDVLRDRSTFMLLYAGDDPLHMSRLHGFDFALRQYSAPRELRRFDCQADPQQALEIIRQQGQRYPTLALWVSLGDWPLAQGPEALRGALAPDTGIVTIGLMPPVWPMLESGACRAVVGTDYGRWGYDAVSLAEQAIRGASQPGQLRLTPPRIFHSSDIQLIRQIWDEWRAGRIRTQASATAPAVVEVR